MLSIELRFPTGRMHATPWGRHVNEGAVEWPPSPWRLLRGLIALWRAGLPDGDEISEESMGRLVEALSAPPSFSLPPASQGHTRHYVPPFKGNTTKIFDSFVVLQPEAPVRLVWPGLELQPSERELLARLLGAMSYFGRAESLVLARIGEPFEGPFDSVPANEPWTDAESELVPVLCPLAPQRYAEWKASQEPPAEPGAKKPAKKPKKSKHALPATLLEALHCETSDLQKAGWSLPPGAAFVAYRRRADAFTPRPQPRRRPSRAPLPTVVRFAVASAVRPRLTEALFVAERQMRPALIKHSDGAPVFAGKDAEGTPLEGNRHAHILCEAAGGAGDAGRISHILLWAPMGFDESAQEALLRLRRIWGFGGHDLQLVLQGMGTPESFDRPLRDGGSDLCRASRVWESVTPFVATRHPKIKPGGRAKVDESGLVIGSPEHDLRRLVAAAGLPAPVSVEPLPAARLAGASVRWAHFRAQRTSGEGRRGDSPAVGYRLEFAEPVRGPIAVGYGASFGLGSFAGKESERPRL